MPYYEALFENRATRTLGSASGEWVSGTPAAPAELSTSSAGQASVRTTIARFHGMETRADEDEIAVEEPLELSLTYGPKDRRQTKAISVTMRTPGSDFELVAGFLMTEGVVSDPAHIAGIAYRKGDKLADRSSSLPDQPGRNSVIVSLEPDVPVSMANLERNFYTTSSCGICGKASLLALQSVCPPRVANTFAVAAEVLYSLPERLRAAQSVFDSTGGLHAAGLFDSTGKLLAIREDVGRHNAVDKLVGASFLADCLPLRERILCLSGRASFELLQKAVMSGIQMVASVGAPFSLAVQVAREFDLTLIGFLRGAHCNAYHGASRIVPEHTAREPQ